MIFCQKRNSPDKAKKAKRWDVLSPPAQDSSHHQDYYIFSRESRTKPSFATGILGGGTTQVIAIGVPCPVCLSRLRWRVAMLNLVDSGLLQPLRDQVLGGQILGDVCGTQMDVSKNRGVYPPKWMVKIMVPTLLKWMIWGKTPYFWKHPNIAVLV